MTIATLLLALSCHGKSTSQIVYTLEEENKLWLSEKALTLCELPQASFPALKRQYEDQNYYFLNNAEIPYTYDPHQLTLDLRIPVQQLASQTIDLYPKATVPAPRPQEAGQYLNYDVHVEDGVTSILDFVLFRSCGVGDLSFLAQDTSQNKNMVRLNTTWTLDQPEKMASWRLGDSITGTTLGNGAVQFGGIQWATNFGTQPGFVPFPLPAFKGEAVVPTTVQFYLGNQLRASNPVKRGAFEIEGVPTVTGGGELFVQTKDLLGRDTIAILPYYVSQALLKPGLTNFSYEMGWVRDNFGLNSNDYGRFLAVGSFQKGITETWTAGWHAELLKDQQLLSLNSAWVVNHFAQVQVAADVSTAAATGVGGLFLAGVQKTDQVTSIGFQATATTHDFQQLGLQPGILPAKWLLQSNASIGTPRWGNIGGSYTKQISRTNPNAKIMTLNYSRTLFKKVAYMMTYIYFQSDITTHSGWISFIWSPFKNHTASLSYSGQQDPFQNQQGVTFAFNKNLPTDNGVGYRMVASTISPQLQGNVALQTDYGLYQANYLKWNDASTLTFDASGGVVYFEKQPFLTRKVNNSFVLAYLPEMPNVRVYNSNQLIGKTNRKGYLFVPNTLPYQENVISLNAADLPLDTQMESDQVIAVPYYRSGAYVKFPIGQVYNVLLTLSTPEEVIPVGANVVLEGGKAYFIGYEGKLFVTQSMSQKRLAGTVHWEDKKCHFSALLPKENQPLIDLGNVACVPL